MHDLLAIQKAIERLGCKESRSYLSFILAKIKLLKEQAETHEAPVAELVELYDELMELQEKQVWWDPTPTCTHVHIVIGDSFAGSMKQALKELGWAGTHKVITLSDNYSMGPLGDLDSPEGRKARSDWFRDHITEDWLPYTEFEEAYHKLLNKLERIPEAAQVIVWARNNACEQAGMRHALHLMRGKSHTFVVGDACSICEALYQGSHASISYMYSGEIPPNKLKEALLRIDESSELNAADLARMAREWQAISEQTDTLRIWREGAVLGVPADYYDLYLLERLDVLEPPEEDNGFLRAARLIGEAFAHCDPYMDASYFEYRLRELIYAGVLEVKGIPAAMRSYSIRRKRTRNGIPND